jgi:hypothetical protein
MSIMSGGTSRFGKKATHRMSFAPSEKFTSFAPSGKITENSMRRAPS